MELSTLGVDPGWFGRKLPRELRLRADVELPVDLRKVPFHGLLAHEERLRDLPVFRTRGREARDLRLGRCELAALDVAGSRGGPPPSRLPAPQGGAERVERLAGALERLACFRLALRAAEDCALGKEDPTELERLPPSLERAGAAGGRGRRRGGALP